MELVPGDHYFEDGGRDEVADLVAAWLAARTELDVADGPPR